MQIVMFYHSLLSCWNHGNAHFLRGVISELISRGHNVMVYEPVDGWSLQNLRRDHGERPVADFQAAYPGLESRFYDPATLDLDQALQGADLVIVHEWNDHDLVQRIGRHRAAHSHYTLLFHDTHHRSASDRDSIARYDLSAYDGVLAFGEVIRELYVKAGWSRCAWTWHEAADTRLFRPLPHMQKTGDLVWIGNWGDDERGEELRNFLLRPVVDLGLSACIHGVRYPDHALKALAELGISYGGWLPNFKAPEVFARHRVTVHVPRRPYVQSLPGIPTIRVFEALACGIPLVSAPWQDSEGLFRPGQDFLFARDGEEMKQHLRDVLNDESMAAEFAANGRETILARHTCAHRVDELLAIYEELNSDPVLAVSSVT
jgi:spore maturation protein CgeB